MLVRHLLIGVVMGALAALGIVLMGFAAWATVGFGVLSANLGLILSAAVGLVPWRFGAGRTAVATRSI